MESGTTAMEAITALVVIFCVICLMNLFITVYPRLAYNCYTFNFHYNYRNKHPQKLRMHAFIHTYIHTYIFI